ncbi:tyrosine decarboxylase [Sporothrix brasiliensis 5110]|uniref:Tyrosine decarboxylase n=1 Tax=Sporothrix brasiliensis 5110 TaxID=1398154 RepID=A0A0C2IN27_9PEZI|nr:tyrosine decarboxylase [Sporothrix brasiliensis 5110]KIH90436.1 tyrosine decarboxylase [Sporothrix brasiliensis 5110]
MSSENITDIGFLSGGYERLRAAVDRLTKQDGADNAVPTLPSSARVQAALAAIPRPGQSDYLQPRGARVAHDHILDTIIPALNGQNLSGRYYGFVTGSVLPIAEAADNIVTALDQNLHAHLPAQTVSTAVEAAALQMLANVFGLDDGDWTGRIFTTGATASNVLGLAMGREAVINTRLRQRRRLSGKGVDSSTASPVSVADLGLLKACQEAGVSDIRILTSLGHSSLYKAASIVGLGRAAIIDLPYSEAEPWRLNISAVEQTLADASQSAGGERQTDSSVAYIISISAGEINTGRFATTGLEDMQRLRALADKYGAWIHVDAAFGLFTRALPSTLEFARIRQYTDGLELADSITSDGHKLLNVNTNASYLTGGAIGQLPDRDGPFVPSPMNMGIENSRRFRALPVYAVLLSEGREGLAAMLARMVRSARGVRQILHRLPEYEVFGDEDASRKDGDLVDDTHIGVLFWAKDESLNANLAERINASRQMYVSPTAWRGRPACRIAVSSWRVAEGDLQVVEVVLRKAVAIGDS